MRIKVQSKPAKPGVVSKFLSAKHQIAERKARLAREQKAAQRIFRAQKNRAAKQVRRKKSDIVKQRKMSLETLGLLDAARRQTLLTPAETALAKLAVHRMHLKKTGGSLFEHSRVEGLLEAASGKKIPNINLVGLSVRVNHWVDPVSSPKSLRNFLRAKAKQQA